MTYKQQIMLNTIKNFIREHGYCPSVRELGELLGLKSTATIHYGLKQLKKKGYIDYIPKKSRTIRIINEQ